MDRLVTKTHFVYKKDVDIGARFSYLVNSVSSKFIVKTHWKPLNACADNPVIEITEDSLSNVFKPENLFFFFFFTDQAKCYRL